MPDDERVLYVVEIFLKDRVLVIATDNVEFTKTLTDTPGFTPDPEA